MPLPVYVTKYCDRLFRKAGISDVGARTHAEDADAGKYYAPLGSLLFKLEAGPRGAFRLFVYLRQGSRAVFLDMIEKQDEANITQAELRYWRSIAKTYDGLLAAQLQQLVTDKDIREIP